MLLPTQPTTLLDELISAARGVAAILVGDRRAPGYFDFSTRGLVGSFIAFLAAATINAFLPDNAPPPSASDAVIVIGPSAQLLLTAALYAVQAGVATLVLRRLKRQEAFVPYLVASNWSSFYLSAAAMLLRVAGVADEPALIFLGIVVIVLEINTARLILTLTPRQIAAFLLLQVLAFIIVAFVLASLFLPSDLTTAAS